MHNWPHLTLPNVILLTHFIDVIDSILKRAAGISVAKKKVIIKAGKTLKIKKEKQRTRKRDKKRYMTIRFLINAKLINTIMSAVLKFY